MINSIFARSSGKASSTSLISVISSGSSLPTMRGVLANPSDFKHGKAMVFPYTFTDGRLITSRWPLDAMQYSLGLAGVILAKKMRKLDSPSITSTYSTFILIRGFPSRCPTESPVSRDMNIQLFASPSVHSIDWIYPYISA